MKYAQVWCLADLFARQDPNFWRAVEFPLITHQPTDDRSVTSFQIHASFQWLASWWRGDGLENSLGPDLAAGEVLVNV
jgi:hypothetical protein